MAVAAAAKWPTIPNHPLAEPWASGQDPRVRVASLSAALVALVLVLLVAGQAAAAPAVRATPCPAGIPADQRDRVDCGLVAVPLRHAEPGGRQIAIAFARVRAARPSAADPILLLAGGPGEKLVAGVGGLLRGSPVGALATDRDLLLIDQRGVGRSRPALECGPAVPGMMGASGPTPERAESEVAAYVGLLQLCAQRLRRAGNDLGAYNTLENVRDLDLVRQALGYAQVNIFGTSYGARLAQQALRGEPAWVRSVALSSPVPAEENFVEDGASSFAGALQRTFALCAASARCRGRYPDLSARLERAMRRLVAEPAEVRLRDPRTGRRVGVPLSASTAAGVLFVLYYAPEGPAVVPRVVDALADGRYQSLAPLFEGVSEAATGSISLGMQYSFLCQEEAAYTSPQRVRSRARSLPLAARLLAADSPVIGRPLFAACAAWGLGRASADTFAPVRSAVPALVVTGQLDQITPPRYGAVVAAQLGTSTLVEVPGVGHSPLLAAGPCGVRILREFVADPARSPSTACLVPAT